MLRKLFHSLPCALILLAVAAPLPAQNPLHFLSQENPAPAFSDITFTADLRVAPLPSGTFSITIGSLPPVDMTSNRSGSAAIYATSELAAGTYIVTATFTPDDKSTPYSASLTEIVTATTGDFTLAAIPPTLTIRDGLTASGLVAATSVNDFHGPVTFACSLPQPIAYTCQLDPPNGSLTLNSYTASTVTLSPTKVPVALNPPPHHRSRTILASLFPLALLPFAAFAARRKRTRLRVLLNLAVLTLLAASTSACGKDIFFAATPPGSYPVLITATGTTPGAPPITHTLSITLNITQ